MMRNCLLFFVFFQKLFTYVLCHERLIPQPKEGPNPFEVESTSSALSLNHLSEVQPPGPGNRHDHENQQEGMKRKSIGISKLNPNANPFVPFSRGQVKFHGRLTQQVDDRYVGLRPPTSWYGPPTASHQNHGLQHPYHQKANLDTERYTDQVRMEINEAVLYKISDGFPMVERLQDWFNDRRMAPGQPPFHDVARKRRKEFLEKIMRYKSAYTTFYALPAIKSNQILEVGFLATYDFGRQVLDAHCRGDSEKIKDLFNAVKAINNDLPSFKPLEEDQLQKILCWPTILAGAMEWFCREALKFSTYLWVLKPKYPPYNEDEKGYDLFNQGKLLDFETVVKHRKQELQVIGRMLGYENQEAEWLNYLQHIWAKSDYHQVNYRIERVLDQMFPTHSFKIESLMSNHVFLNYAKWSKLEPKTLKYLVKVARDTSTSRGKYTMHYTLSRDCLNHFSQRLLELVTHLVKKNGLAQDSTVDEACGKLLQKLYFPRYTSGSAQPFTISN